MKRFVWILLVIGAIAQPMSKPGIYLLFQTNQTYIAAHLCEKRAVPDSDCQGKCYLNKKLKKAEERQEQEQEQAPQAQKQVTIAIIPAGAGFKIEQVVYEQLHEEPAMHYHIKSYLALACSIFHPPKAIALIFDTLVPDMAH